MSHSCSRLALAAQKSYNGGGITCRCTQSGQRGTTLKPSMSPCVHYTRSSSSKGMKQKAQSTLQDRFKNIKESVVSASARVQDSIHSSREAFLGSIHTLQMQSDNKEAKTLSKDEYDRVGKTYESVIHISSTSSMLDRNHNSSSRHVPEAKESYNDGGLERESSTTQDVASQTKEPDVQLKQPDFWINIPSLQDRINRMKIPFLKTIATGSTSRSASEDSQSEQQTEGGVHLEPKVNGRRSQDGQTRDADEFKRESYHVTAEAQSDELSHQESEGSKEQGMIPSLKIGTTSIHIPSIDLQNSLPNIIRSIPGLRSSDDRKEKLRRDDSNTSLQESDESNRFDFDASPILDMNVALLEPREMHRGGNKQVSAAKETENEARMWKERAIVSEDMAIKKTKKPMKPVISKACIDNRTRNLAIGIRCATTNSSRLLKLENLAAHLMRYPESREVAVNEKLIPSLLKIKNSRDKVLTERVNETLALLGYAPPVKGRGIRILSVDGGGTRGVIAIEALRDIERRTQKPIRELFDYMIGVSSGAVICFLLAFDGASLDECEELYRELSQDIFKRNTFLGTGKLFLNHAFYDTEGWIKILRTHSLGDIPMMSTVRDATCPKVAAVATMMNIGCIKNFLFRNYNLPSGVQSHYRGSCKYELWQAARASSAAPGYFEEFKLDDYVFQDGGVLTNNPSALAIHECRLLWPDTPIQCVVSIGCGRYDPSDDSAEPEYSSLKKKLTDIMMSATDTESVHTVLQDLLPGGAYFRFNPPITEDFLLDENRTEKIAQMQREAQDYLELNELKLEQASGVLSREKTSPQRLLDWVRLQRELRRR